MFYEKIHKKKIISEIICLISGATLTMVGLYYFHMQYLCYEYTPLLFVFAFAVCLGGALLSVPLGKNTEKKKNVINSVVTASVFADSFVYDTTLHGNNPTERQGNKYNMRKNRERITTKRVGKRKVDAVSVFASKLSN